jgi:hypothetical protein
MGIDLFHNYKAYKSSVNVKNKNKITARCLLAALLRQFRCRFLRPLIASHVRAITQPRPLNPKPKHPDISNATEKTYRYRTRPVSLVSGVWCELVRLHRPLPSQRQQPLELGAKARISAAPQTNFARV